MIRQTNGSAVYGKSPSRVYLRGRAVVVRVKVTGASSWVEA
jgi:hypothetical protein